MAKSSPSDRAFAGPEGRYSSSPPTGDTHMTAHAALEAGGVARLRVLAAAMLLLIQVGMVSVALFDADRYIKQLAWGALVVMLGLFMYSWLRLEQRQYVQTKEVSRIAIPMSVAVVVANFAFGMASTFCAAVTLGLLLFSSSASRRNARNSFWIIAIGYTLTGLLLRLNLFSYRPIVPLKFAVPWQADASMITVLCLYFSAYFSGRMMRREMARVVEQFERAVREASYRDALFREARDALKQAAGIGGPGRFTDQELDGYKLGEVIGRGGMGEVYAAVRREDAFPAAVKLLRLDFLGEKTAVQRFEREAAIAGSINSPHVVRVLAVSGPDAVLPYIAMERLTGTDLGTYLRERGRLPVDEVCDLVRQTAAGLEAAHERSVVHRDLKPSNVFRTITDEAIEPVWKVLDFGVSKLSGGLDLTLTANELIGTPQYMAPEQARGERDLDSRTDIYGLSAIAYRAITGEPPFTGELPSILHYILEQMPAAPSTRAELPHDVDLVFALGLAKRREDRFATASALSQALSQAARGELDESLRARARGLLHDQPYAA
ncbi:MAG: serine/threonine protein kinase [Myxococcaceae bacterium]|nr:serine/threonine protein kinase [Myxococcaceae bacterium]